MKTLLTMLLTCLCFIVKAQTANIRFVLPKDILTYQAPLPDAHIALNLKKGDTIIINDYNNGYWYAVFKGNKIYAFEPQWDGNGLELLKDKFSKSQERIKPTSISIGIFASDVTDLFGDPAEKNITTGEWGHTSSGFIETLILR